jgi:hypothetical protein
VLLNSLIMKFITPTRVLVDRISYSHFLRGLGFIHKNNLTLIFMKFTKLFALIIFLFCYASSFSQTQTAGVTSIGSATACPNTVINIPLYVTHTP